MGEVIARSVSERRPNGKSRTKWEIPVYSSKEETL